MRCILNAEEGVEAACALYVITQLYAAFPHIMVEGVGASSQPASKGGYVPVLFGNSDIDFREFLFSTHLGE
jgi:hypothetical protein